MQAAARAVAHHDVINTSGRRRSNTEERKRIKLQMSVPSPVCSTVQAIEGPAQHSRHRCFRVGIHVTLAQQIKHLLLPAIGISSPL